MEEKLKKYQKEIESFKKKDLASADEMQRNVEKLTEITQNLDDAASEVEVLYSLLQLYLVRFRLVDRDHTEFR